MKKFEKNLSAKLCNAKQVKDRSRRQINTTNDIDVLENIVVL